MNEVWRERPLKGWQFRRHRSRDRLCSLVAKAHDPRRTAVPAGRKNPLPPVKFSPNEPDKLLKIKGNCSKTNLERT